MPGEAHLTFDIHHFPPFVLVRSTVHCDWWIINISQLTEHMYIRFYITQRNQWLTSLFDFMCYCYLIHFYILRQFNNEKFTRNFYLWAYLYESSLRNRSFDWKSRAKKEERVHLKKRNVDDCFDFKSQKRSALYFWQSEQQMFDSEVDERKGS